MLSSENVDELGPIILQTRNIIVGSIAVAISLRYVQLCVYCIPKMLRNKNVPEEVFINISKGVNF